MTTTLELEELTLALDLRAIAPAHAVAMAADLAGLALPAGSIVRGVTSTLCEFHVGHRLELSVPTAAGYAVAALERRQLTPAHPVEWTLSYQQRAGSSNRTHHRGDAGTHDGEDGEVTCGDRRDGTEQVGGEIGGGALRGGGDERSSGSEGAMSMSDYEQMVADCEARESRLTEWEADFIQSLRERIDAGRGVTDRQAEMLDRVWTRATSKG